MKAKRFFSALLVIVLTLGITSMAVAAPYQNYTVTESGYYPEPQAYVPSAVYNTLTIGLEQLEGIPLNAPQDILLFKATGDVLISDTGNNRIVILDNSMKTVKQIISKFTYQDKAETFNAPNGLFIADEVQMLYVCDTDNARIVRFVYDAEQGFVIDTIFTDPNISQYLTEQPDETTTEATTAPDGSVPTEAPAETATPAPEETADPNVTANPDATTTPAPTTAPTTSEGGIKYAPTKLVVDDSMRMYVVSKGNYMGLIELSKDGSFSKFMGATRVRQTLSDLWKRILNAAQKSTLTKTLSTEYSNVSMDKDGFIFGTISNITAADLSSHFSSGTEVSAPVRKLNASGLDVLLRQGFYPPAGDWGYYNDRSSFSYFVDICVSDVGLYSVLDQNKGRVFTYSSTGDLLYVFGAIGEIGSSNVKVSKDDQVGYTMGTALQPVAIELLDEDTVMVLDGKGAQITVYEPTDYGLLMRSAIYYHETRQYDKAMEAWNSILGQSSNSSLAYTGIGRIKYMNGEYKEATEYFKKGFNQTEYKKAFNKYRNEVLAKVIPYLMTAIIALTVILLILGWTKKFKAFVKRGGKRDA